MDRQLPFNFELANPHLDLLDVDPNGPINPGDAYLVRWATDQGLDSWIGIICDDDMLPLEFLARKPDANDFGAVYPVWLIGRKNGFKWIHISLIHILNDGIRDAFEFSPDWDDFSAAYSAVMEKLGHKYWEETIERARTEDNVAQAYVEDEDTITVDVQGVRKRKRVQEDDVDLAKILDRASGSSITIIGDGATADGGKEKTLRIKKEAIDDPAASTQGPLIAVYIGQNNAKFMIRKTALAQSEYLTSLTITRPNNPQPFITDPDLMAIDIADFHHIQSYLESGEFTAKSELRLSGRIYCLAHKFGLERLKSIVSRKITSAARQAKPMLTLVGYIFNQINGEDSLKEWLLNWVAEHFRDLSLRDNAALWQMLDNNEDLQAQIFVTKGEMMKKEWGAKQVVKIEESEDEGVFGTGS